MLYSLRQAYRRTGLRTTFKHIVFNWRKRGLHNSAPWTMELGGRTLAFRTDDPYSHQWFYPRYSDGQWHERTASERWVEACSKARVIVDVGANLGWYACLAATGNPYAEIIAFEASSANCQLFRQNLELNSKIRIQIDERVVSADSHGAPWQENTLGLPHASNQCVGNYEAALLESVSLDEYFAERAPPDLVKIDVEGHEGAVLRGMRGILNSTPPNQMLIELHPEWLAQSNESAQDIVEQLQSAGYTLTWLLRDGEAMEDISTQFANGDRMIWASRSPSLVEPAKLL